MILSREGIEVHSRIKSDRSILLLLYYRKVDVVTSLAEREL